MKDGAGVDESALEVYNKTGLFSQKYALVQINSEKPCSLSDARGQPSFGVLRAMNEESVFGRKFCREGGE